MAKITYCDNNFCLYWEENLCILDHIELDAHGTCRNSIYVEIDEEYLEYKRQMFLDKLDKQINDLKGKK